MLLFADEFWKPPNVYDAVGVAGFVIGLVSIWLSWWLARRDLRKRIEGAKHEVAESAKGELRRLVEGIVNTGVADAIRALDVARELSRSRQWSRATLWCRQGCELLERVGGQSTGDAERINLLELAAANVREFIRSLHERGRDNQGAMPPESLDRFDEAIRSLHRLLGRLVTPSMGDGSGP